MHVRRSVFYRTDEETGKPFIITVDVSPGDTDTAATPPIKTDEPDNFEGTTSPRVLQKLSDDVKALQNG